MERFLKAKMNYRTVYRFLLQENISQNELAERLGISSGYMSQLVNGRRYPSPRLRKKMLHVFRSLTFGDLFYLEDKDASI